MKNERSSEPTPSKSRFQQDRRKKTGIRCVLDILQFLLPRIHEEGKPIDEQRTGMPHLIVLGDEVFEVGLFFLQQAKHCDAESKDFENIEKWYFDGEDLNKVSKKTRMLSAEPFDLMYCL